MELRRSAITMVKSIVLLRKLASILGRGAFGDVYEGMLVGSADPSERTAVAVKTLPMHNSAIEELDFRMEAIIMSKFDHANIVKLIGVCFDSRPYYIVLELLEGGDLKTFLREVRPRQKRSTDIHATLLDLIKLSLDVANGCQYLEENRFVHRDIAARNCLLTSKHCQRIAKIADFGMARDVYKSEYYRKGGKTVLPVRWMPPEAFLDGIFTSKTDVWSFGVLLWEMFSFGYMPYPGRSNLEVIDLVTAGGRLETPSSCPDAVSELMRTCWERDADQRPSFKEIVHRLQDVLRNWCDTSAQMMPSSQADDVDDVAMATASVSAANFIDVDDCIANRCENHVNC